MVLVILAWSMKQLKEVKNLQKVRLFLPSPDIS